tara:strand:- start:70 stop:459 length:390 start_codon:yes stop_codon:yes gene_type:complete
LNTAKPKKPYRWVLLRHTDAPDDLIGIHYDFLLEDSGFCRTWRLNDIPLLNGSSVDCVYIDPHKLEWLDIKEKVVSGNRGVATRIKKGIFFQSLSLCMDRSSINLSLLWDDLEVDLVIAENSFRIFSNK